MGFMNFSLPGFLSGAKQEDNEVLQEEESIEDIILSMRSKPVVLEKRDFLPRGKTVRGSISKDFGVTGNDLSNMAVAMLGGGGCVLLIAEGVVGKRKHIDLREKIIDKDFLIFDERVASASFLAEFNNAINKNIEESSSSDVSAIIEEILVAAVGKESSDIHICCREKTGMILFRIHGKLTGFRQYKEIICKQIAGYFYQNMSEPTSRSDPNFNISSKSLSCVIKWTHNFKHYKLRYKFVSMADGWDVIIRVLNVDDPNAPLKTFKDLGYEDSQVSQIETAVKRSTGLVAILGPTGSGKSTTLKTMMEFDPNRRFKKSYSVEDPVEYKIYGVSQISIQRNDHEKDFENASFTGVLRDILRSDPDNVMVGETRDASTAMMLADAIMTGHKLYTTLHTASAISAYLRLSRLGVDRQILADRQFVSVLIFQKLLPVLCPHCKISATETGILTDTQRFFLESSYGLNLSSVFCTNDDGCEHCHNGVKASTVVAEVVVPDYTIRKYIAEGRDEDAEQYWRKKRKTAFDDPDMEGKTAFEHALYKVSQGLIDPKIVEQEFETFETYEVFSLES